MKKQLYTLVLLFGGLLFNMRLLADVTITSWSVNAANIPQGTSKRVVYALHYTSTSSPGILTSIQFTLGGSHDNDDLNGVKIWFDRYGNPPLTHYATLIANYTGSYAAPHTYTITNFQNLTVQESGYIWITVPVDASASIGNTVKLDGAANPVILEFSNSPIIHNNQTNAAGLQTISAAIPTPQVTLTSIPVPAGNIGQGTTYNNVVYIVKMEATFSNVSTFQCHVTLTGTHDNNDFALISVKFNPSAPTEPPGNQSEGSYPVWFNAPHTYDINLVARTLTQGQSGYFIISVWATDSATNGNTIKIDGSANPVSFTFNNDDPSPIVTSNQTDVAGTQTIRAAEVTLSSIILPAADIPQGTGNKIVYIAKMDVSIYNTVITSIQFTLTGTHDNNDLTNVVVYLNSVPSLSGSPTNLGPVSGLFASPHTYTVTGFGNKTVTAGTTAYFIITVTTATNATSGNTVKIDGNTNPVTLGLTLAPTIINNQADVAGPQTIRAADITLTSIPVTASEILQGTANNIIYITKMEVSTFWIMLNSINFTLTGTHDANDLTSVVVYINYATPTLTGATFFGSSSGLYAAPHNYVINSGIRTIDAGQSPYFIITVTTAMAATVGNTVIVNGQANPVSFGYYYSTPNLTNNQTNAAGAKTIAETLPLTLISFTGNLLNRENTQLQWVTAAEINTKEFEVEWSKDGLKFNKIAVVPAAGNSSQNIHYNYIHTQPAGGNNYYRLKMTDIDGRFSYSPVVNVKITNSNTVITAYPNPVISVLQLRIQSDRDENILFHLHSADGRILESRSFNVVKGTNQLNWNMQRFAKGYYFISSGNKQFETIKVNKQ